MNAIEIKKLYKHFTLHEDKPRTLKEKVLRLNKNLNKKNINVLSNINLNIPKGKVVGLVGRNGSGKSTLLKLLSKIIYPNSGEISIYGRVTSLLELGAGFHPEFTGIENIYMNASLFGLNKKEIDAKINDIVSFSELGEYINRPVRIYSSGMYMRLAFSIATIVEPDILLVDEVLAVGDAAFQQKCLSRIMTLKEKGKTIVIVAHDQSVIERLCDYCIWLKNGMVVKEGPTKEVFIQYLEDMGRDEDKRVENVGLEAKKVEKSSNTKDANRWGNLKSEIINVDVTGRDGIVKRAFNTNDYLRININFKCNKESITEDLAFGIAIFRSDGVLCYGTNSTIDKIDLEFNGIQGMVSIVFPEISLLPGEYWIDVAAHSISGEPYDYIKKTSNFVVYSEYKDEGILRIRHTWELL